MLRLIAGFLAGMCCFANCNAQGPTIVIREARVADARRDLPVGVTSITADDIRKSASSNLGDILAQFGLLQIRDLAGTQNPQLDLRGFGITGDQNTLVLLDGLRLSEADLESAQLSAIPLESIERIEIVRGAVAVLYGAAAIARPTDSGGSTRCCLPGAPTSRLASMSSARVCRDRSPRRRSTPIRARAPRRATGASVTARKRPPAARITWAVTS